MNSYRKPIYWVNLSTNSAEADCQALSVGFVEFGVVDGYRDFIAVVVSEDFNVNHFNLRLKVAN
ncbi:hypothetical protein D3C81_2331230 [compost metagenome]